MTLQFTVPCAKTFVEQHTSRTGKRKRKYFMAFLASERCWLHRSRTLFPVLFSPASFLGLNFALVELRYCGTRFHSCLRGLAKIPSNHQVLFGRRRRPQDGRDTPP